MPTAFDGTLPCARPIPTLLLLAPDTSHYLATTQSPPGLSSSIVMSGFLHAHRVIGRPLSRAEVQPPVLTEPVQAPRPAIAVHRPSVKQEAMRTSIAKGLSQRLAG